MTQTELALEPRPEKSRPYRGLTVRDCVLLILTGERGRKWRLPELQQAVTDRLGRYVTDGCVSAKLRDLRKRAYGSHDVRAELLSGRTWGYWIP